MRAAELSDFAPDDDPAARVLRAAQARARLRGPLFVHGNLEVLLRPRVSFGGSRQSQGWNWTALEGLAGAVATRGACVVSGGAVGADVAAHRGALERGGVTAIVLPVPLDDVNPRAWRPELRTLLSEEACLFVSPFARGEVITRGHPVLRNRLVAALGGAVVAGKTGLQGGTNHLLRFAREMRVPTWFLDDPTADPTLRAALLRLREWGARPFAPEDALEPRLADAIVAAARLPPREPAHQPSLFDGAD